MPPEMPSITRRRFGATAAAALAGVVASNAEESRPNILFVCSDQHSGLALRQNGDAIVQTPNLDRLAGRGVTFRHTYCANPVCTPARASLMTGAFASDVESYCNSTPFDGRIPTFANRLRSAGYRCWATGKLDLAADHDLGFEEHNTYHGHWTDPDVTSLFRAPVGCRIDERGLVDGKFVPAQPNRDHARASDFVDFLGHAPQTPWLAYVGLHLPHPPWTVPASYLDRFPPDSMPLPRVGPEFLDQHMAFQVMANFKNIARPIPVDTMRRARAAYYGALAEADISIGRMMEALERSGQADRTIVVYTSDHGDMQGAHGLWMKNVLLEGAARVPLIVAGPGAAGGRTVDTPVSHVDLVATLLDLGMAGRDSRIRGTSLAALLRGDASHAPGYVFAESHSEGNCTGSFLVRRGPWKYIHFVGDKPLLFHLGEDPDETRNLAGIPRHAEVEHELAATLRATVDPDAVNRAAFGAQRRVLAAMLRRLQPDAFYKQMVSRFGEAQARALTDSAYRGPA